MLLVEVDSKIMKAGNTDKIMKAKLCLCAYRVLGKSCNVATIFPKTASSNLLVFCTSAKGAITDFKTRDL